MIYSMTAMDANGGDSMTFVLSNPYETGIVLTDITGLGPTEATINTTELATVDGSFFNSSKLEERTIVITFKFIPTSDVEWCRHQLYKLFSPKGKMKLIFNTEERSEYIIGYVNRHESTIFGKDSAASSITITCPDPFFYDNVGSSRLSFSNVSREFEFPFSTETDRTTDKVMGEIGSEAVVNFNYKGEVSTGFDYIIEAYGDVTGDLVLYNLYDQDTMTISTDQIASQLGSTFTNGDVIHICTVRGKKNAQVERNGEYTNIIKAISRSSDWIQLDPGENYLGYRAESGIENLAVSIKYPILYGGV